MAQISSNKCGICTEFEGTVLCYECQDHLCDACRAWHDKFPLSKLHTVVDSSQVDKVFSTTKLLCENHNRLFIHYCKKCCCLTCAACATSDHQSHPLTDVSEVSAQARSEVNEYIDDIKTKVKQLTELSDNIRSHRLKQDEEDKETFTNAVKLISDEFRNIINSVADIFITRATDHLVLRQQYFQNFLDKTGELSEVCQLVRTKLERALTETHDVAFYVQYKALNREYDELDEIPQLEEPEAIGEFKEEEFTASVVDKIEEKYDLSCTSSIQQKDQEALSLLASKDSILKSKEEAMSLLNKRDKEVTQLKRDIENIESLLKAKKEEIKKLVQKSENNTGYMRTLPGQTIVIVKMRLGKSMSVAIRTSDKIRTLKELIETREGIPVDQQNLFLTGSTLCRCDKLFDDFDFAKYGIHDGSCLELRRYL